MHPTRNSELKTMNSICECVHDMLIWLECKPLSFVLNKSNFELSGYFVNYTIQNTEYNIGYTLLNSVVLQLSMW